jgi:hypothetical protein
MINKDRCTGAMLNRRAWTLYFDCDRTGRAYNVNVTEEEIKNHDFYPIPIVLWLR